MGNYHFFNTIDPLFIYPNVVKKDKGCVYEARIMFFESHGGELYLVSEMYNGKPFVHFYFIPQDAPDYSYALNSWENGYFDYPRLTVREVRTYGKLFTPQEI